MESKVGLDFQKVEQAKRVAYNIANEVQNFAEQYTTVAVERTICRLLGVDGVDENGVPLPNVLIDQIKEKGVLGEGIIYFMGNAMLVTGKMPQEIAEDVSENLLDIHATPASWGTQRAAESLGKRRL